MIDTMEISPKRAIIINTFNPKLLCSVPVSPVAILPDESIVKIEPGMNKKGRKRTLEHLSYEEKILRKKLKNREAAQTSRDRKKARMDDLERNVKCLEKQNRELSLKVTNLSKDKQDLQNENEKLREELRCARVEYDYLSWLSENCEYDLTQLDELVNDLFSQSNITKEYDELVDKMVGPPSEIVESSRLEQFRVDDSLLKPENNASSFPKEKISSTLVQDAWNMTTSSGVPSKHSVPTELIKEEPLIITTPELEISTEDSLSDEMYEDMMSEEIVITSDEPSLFDACDSIPEINSTCSDADTDERNTDQGYESIDSPTSDTDNPLSELFPELVYCKPELLVY